MHARTMLSGMRFLKQIYVLKLKHETWFATPLVELELLSFKFLVKPRQGLLQLRFVCVWWRGGGSLRAAVLRCWGGGMGVSASFNKISQQTI